MNANVEKGIVAVLNEALVGQHIREATSADPLPTNIQLVIVQCENVEHVVGPLHKATVKVMIGTPAFDASVPEHNHTSGRVRDAALAWQTESPAATFDAVAGLEWRGCHVKSVGLDFPENTWRTTIELTVGLASS